MGIRFDNDLATATRFLGLDLALPIRVLLCVYPSSGLFPPTNKELAPAPQMALGLGA